MWFLGIDWSEKHLDFCLEKQSGDVILRSRVDNDDNGFNSMLNQFLQLNVSSAEVAMGIESPHQRSNNPLTPFGKGDWFSLWKRASFYRPLAHGVSVYPVNPAAVHDYRKSRFPSGGESGCTTAFRSKSDTADAQLIADYLREHHTHLKIWCLSEPELRELSLLVEDRDKLVQQKVRLQNQLRSTLCQYFPQAVMEIPPPPLRERERGQKLFLI